MPKLYVAICGEIGAGKGTLVKLLLGKLKEAGISTESCRFSDVPRAHLARWGMPESRENMQYVTSTMRKHSSGELLPKLFAEYLKEKTADVVIIDGPRWAEDEEFVRGLTGNLLIYITAPRKTRLARINARCENAGEGKLVMADLIRQEKRAVERYIPVMGSHADIKIENKGTPEELKEKIKGCIPALLNN